MPREKMCKKMQNDDKVSSGLLSLKRHKTQKRINPSPLFLKENWQRGIIGRVEPDSLNKNVTKVSDVHVGWSDM